MPIWLPILVFAGAYLLGSIPTAYVFARWHSGIDIRRYGSGTVSGSMVWEHVSRWGVVAVGLFDVGKAAAATWLGYQISLPAAVAAGLLATIGHNWPLFLRFVGGRGLGCFLGICVIVFPWGCAWILLSLALGRGNQPRLGALGAGGHAGLPLLRDSAERAGRRRMGMRGNVARHCGQAPRSQSPAPAGGSLGMGACSPVSLLAGSRHSQLG